VHCRWSGRTCDR